jgi:hypothetical protein
MYGRLGHSMKDMSRSFQFVFFVPLQAQSLARPEVTQAHHTSTIMRLISDERRSALTDALQSYSQTQL